MERVQKINPNIQTQLSIALAKRPSLDTDQFNLLHAFGVIIRPSRTERRSIYLADIAPAIPIFEPKDNREFVEDILNIESKIKWKESSESESTKKAR